MIFRLLLVSIFSLFAIMPVGATEMCAQVIQYAENTTKSECQAFPTPCDVPTGWSPVSECRITSPAKVSKTTFQVQKFASCEDLEKKLFDIVDTYQSRYWYPYPMYARDVDRASVGGAVAEKAAVGTTSMPTPQVNSSSVGSNFSTTNTQVLGVDEADTVKTDGTFLYSYSEESHEVRIVRATTMALEKTISLPENWGSVTLYLSSGKLVVVGTKYSNTQSSWSYRWYAPDVKTVIALYSLTDTKNPVLERYHEIDGSYRESRVSDGILYFITSNPLRFPPYYSGLYAKKDNGYALGRADAEKNFSLKQVVPDIRESFLGKKGKYTQSFRSSVASCKDITFVLPDNETMKRIDMNPSFVTVSSLDLRSPTAKMTSDLVFGDVSEIHMSKNALYLTSVVSQSIVSSRSACPAGANCFAPSTITTTETLVHKYNLAGGKASYAYTARVSGNPMNQYSMDEDTAGNFRIVTQNYAWSSSGNKNTTELSVLSPTGKLIGSLRDIAPGENFQSARFIGNRLYLVTFQQIDPLFVIDITDAKSPKILGELKIPGYSTYLHPYDADRLIGIGYDTHTNQWGGIQNGGLKIDLYNVSDVKKPRQEATLTIGDAGSYSDVLTNPRAFIYYREKNLLLMPATIMKSAGDTTDPYRYASAFQGVVGISILPSSITEKFRISHITLSQAIEDAWKKDCAQYSGEKPACRKLLDGSEYCGSSSSYVPPYCYAGSTVETYFASQMWNYSRDFISRSLYIGDTFYTFGEGAIKSWNITSPSSPKGSVDFASREKPPPRYPVPMMMR